MGSTVRSMDWSIVGLSHEDSMRLDQLAGGDDEFTVSQLVGLWQQWVTELESGQLWVREDFQSALDSRDDLDAALPLVPSDVARAVFRVVDGLDRKFRDATAAATAPSDDSERWWRCRVPIANSQRLYLFEKLDGQP